MKRLAKTVLLGLAAAAALSFTPASGTDWISIGVPRRGVRSAGVVAKVFENKADVVSAEWTVSGLGVFTAYVNGREIGADNALKPGFTDREKRRNTFTFDATPFLNVRAGETNILAAVLTSGWWSDNIIGRVRGRAAMLSVSECHPKEFSRFTPKWGGAYIACVS